MTRVAGSGLRTCETRIARKATRRLRVSYAGVSLVVGFVPE